MTNKELANIFSLIADLLEIKGEVIYKTLAYRKAADSLVNLDRDAKDYWKEGKLTDIPGVGKAISAKIDELLTSGKLEYLEKLQKEVPAELAELLQIPELGPKKVALLYKELGITSVADLKKAAEDGKIQALPGMGSKSETKILAGIESLSRRSGRAPLGSILPAAQELMSKLKAVDGVVEAELAGSLRRMQATVGDIDILIASKNPELVSKIFVEDPKVARIIGHGEIKSSVEYHNGLRAQIWVHPPERFGTALQYATGSKEHNVRTREIAQAVGLSLTDQAIIQKDGSEIHYSNEQDVYAAIGLEWVAPELREDRGEIQAAKEGNLPDLIEVKHIRAELHCHSKWSDGKASIMEMAQAAISRGYKTLAITDHSISLGIGNGLSIERLQKQRIEIEKVRKELGNDLLLLHGTEMEIKADASLDFPDEILEWLDIVVASLHVSMRQERAIVTNRMLNAIRNPHVDIIGHPTNRLLPNREGSDLDMEAVFQAALEMGTALEINANPKRLDLDDIYARRAMELGIPLVINTDAHRPEHMDFIHYGVATGRRAWASPKSVINAWTAKQINTWLNKRG